MPGIHADDAWRQVAGGLADMLLGLSLMGAGWEVIEEVTDESTYFVARDPTGEVWAVAVGANARGYSEPDMKADGRAERLAYVDVLDTQSPEALMAALSEQL